MLFTEAFDHDEIAKIIEASKTYLIGMQINKYWNHPNIDTEKAYDVTCVSLDRETFDCQETFFPTRIFTMPLMVDAMVRALSVELAMHDIEMTPEWGVSVWDMDKDDPQLGMEFIIPHESSIEDLNSAFYYIEDNPEDNKPALRLV